MTRIALDTPVASHRLALRRWLEARGHELCALDEPGVELVLGDTPRSDHLPARLIPFLDESGSGRIDFDRLDLVLADFAVESGRVMTLAGGAVVGIVGRSPAMQRLEAQIDRLAAVDLPVLIQGESGSGKEVVARELHRRGPRRNAPFVAVNCAAIPEGLFESELFGHERGSFTDASQRRRGHFERAGEGTLLLDEVGDLPSTVQAKLLRALQDRQFYRIGAESPIEFRARILSATALELEEDPRFRTDLYHRIAGARLRVPALRERREDLPDLCRLILGRMPDHGITGIGADAIARLAELEWPGNVRQLENLLGQIAIFAQGPVLDAGALEPFLHRSRGTEGTWFQEALRVWVTAQRAAGHSAAELREELLDRLRGIESQIDPPPNQGTRPKPPRP